MFRNILFCISLSLFVLSATTAQDEAQRNNSILAFHLGLSYNFPGGDLSDRYGRSAGWSLGTEFMTAGNWIVGGDMNYMFGDRINEDPISSLRTSQGFVLGSDNQYADVFLRFRGIHVGFYVGKVFPLSKDDRSGIRFTNSFGILQHNFRFLDETSSVFQLSGDYSKGYDRLTRGFALKQFIGWQNIDKKKRLNFIAGFEISEGFTKSVRGFNFDTQMPDTERRMDLMISLKVAWILPIFSGSSSNDEEIFY